MVADVYPADLSGETSWQPPGVVVSFGLNREIDRRASDLIRLNKLEAGGTLRIGGGWRSEQRAYDEFFRRYTFYGPTRPSLLHPILRRDAKFYPGDDKHRAGWYTLNQSEIGLATPGNSYHTDCPPDALTGDTGAVAIDWVNELVWMQQNGHRVGLRSFQHIPGEGHHTQPVEYPGSRRDFNPNIHRLTVWALPGDDTMMRLIRPINDTTVLRLGTDGTCVWVKDGNILADLVEQGLVDPTLVDNVSRRSLSAWVLQGPVPVYAPIPGRTDKTVAADFAKWLP